MDNKHMPHKVKIIYPFQTSIAASLKFENG